MAEERAVTETASDQAGGAGPEASETQARARAAATQHPLQFAPGPHAPLLHRLALYQTVLRQAHTTFASEEAEAIRPEGAEWLLDNFFLVLQGIREVRQDLPPRFYGQLPRIAAYPLKGYPRAYAVAREVAQTSDGRLDVESLVLFLEAYQEVSPLTTGEIWAVPAMLRFCIIEALASTVSRLLGNDLPLQGPSARLSPSLSPAAMFANCIQSLRRLNEEDWTQFFERVSLVEKRLRQDPAQAYHRMEFDSRDRYRKVVEHLSRETGMQEIEIAAQAVALASGQAASPDQPARVRHVGYYLSGDGLAALELRLGYRPRGAEALRRLILTRAGPAYFTGIGLTGLIVTGLFGLALIAAGVGPGLLALSLALTAVPAVTLANSVVDWLVMRVVPPRLLPKLDFREEIPEEYRTLVVLPSMLTDRAGVQSLAQQLEKHFLRNGQPNLYFALLTDFRDAGQKDLPGDMELVRAAVAALEALNERYSQDYRPFYLFHRERLWNPSEGVWMGWERKRGKLDELNRLIQGASDASITTKVGDLSALRSVRFVITLDEDTDLPREAAHRLIGTLAHPLNQPLLDPSTGRMSAGYSVVQPRTEVNPASGQQSLFARVFAGTKGIDLYTHAVSDVYQDLFGEGIYVGKGIYDVRAFHASVSGVVPENALLSHDLFEATQARAALASDITVYEEYPAGYLQYALRQHRWIRGDWQLLPWLLGHARGAAPGRKAVLRPVDRWKVLSNLLRSLNAPLLVALLLASWVLLPGGAHWWSVGLTLATLGTPLLAAFLTQLLGMRTDVGRLVSRLSLGGQALRFAFGVVFLLHEAVLAVDAIGRTLVRVYITHRRLLQWTPASQVARRLGRTAARDRHFWAAMAAAPLAAVVFAAVVGLAHPAAAVSAGPLLAAWLLSPQVTAWASRARSQGGANLDQEARDTLRKLARRTWLFFETFARPEEGWLPPDHYQEFPKGVVAHRTSPTNIGLGLLASLAAYDFGWVGALDLGARLENLFITLGKLKRHRGHLLNWYDTRSREPLPPEYVSTVDSGNLVASLIVLKQGIEDVLDGPVLPVQRWSGFVDTVSVFVDVVAHCEDANPDLRAAVLEHARELVEWARVAAGAPDGWAGLVERLADDGGPELERRVLRLVEDNDFTPSIPDLRSLHIWLERVKHQVWSMRRTVDTLLPWSVGAVITNAPHEVAGAAPESELGRAWQQFLESARAHPPLSALPQHCGRIRDALSRLRGCTGDGEADGVTARWCEELTAAVDRAREAAEELLGRYHRISEQADRITTETDFRFLYDTRRKLFRIGYNATTGRPDHSYYDLLASEARLASLVAIAKGDVPGRHWAYLSRPLTLADGSLVLLSWAGTAFEYLMPALYLKHPPYTLLGQSIHNAVRVQMAYARRKNLPWGMSESGYYAFDSQRNYQYQAFGVPALGLKRGLEDELVVAPYASLMAVAFEPREVMRNLEELTKLLGMGDYGLREAIDFTAARMPKGRRCMVVRSYMAHHQGMILMAMVNTLCRDVMVDRFQADVRIASLELLLQERAPQQATVERPPAVEREVEALPKPQGQIGIWRVPLITAFPVTQVLSNGDYRVMVTNGGGGYSAWKGVDLTRWRADTTLDEWGTWLYIQDRDDGALWSVSPQPMPGSADPREVIYAGHKAEFNCTRGAISAHLEIAVCPGDPVEVRWLTLHNQSGEERRLAVTSYGEPVLTPQRADRQHPAFNKLFIETAPLPSGNGLLLQRRRRSVEEPEVHLAHFVVAARDRVPSAPTYESDRAAFLGRGQTARTPAGLREREGGLPNTSGSTLDPVFAVRQEVDIPPRGAVRLAFVTAAAATALDALALVRRYSDWPNIELAFDDARAQGDQLLVQHGLGGEGWQWGLVLLSLLHYPHPALRPPASQLAANKRGASGLWPFSISGDNPILLVKTVEAADSTLVRDVLRAHGYWRDRGLRIDLVLLEAGGDAYQRTTRGRLMRAARETHAEGYLNQPGGVFLLSTATMSDSECVLLESAARVVLDEARGSLAAQLRDAHVLPRGLPAHAPGPPAPRRSSAQPLERPVGLLLDNGLGGFSPDGREYVVYLRPDEWTPAPWVNVIANEKVGCIVSESGLGCTWAINSALNRLTPWANDPVSDPPGEAVYIRDEETVEIWSPTPLPAGEAAPYLVRHGSGYTVFEHRSHDLDQTLTVFAARDDPIKVVRLALRNTSDAQRRITVTYYAELVLGTAPDEARQYVIPQYERSVHAILARNPDNLAVPQHVAFVAANRELHGITSNRGEFLGRMGDRRRPAGLARIGLSGRVDAGVDPCAAMQLHVNLAPGEEQQVFFLVGQAPSAPEVVELVRSYQSPDRVQQALDEAVRFWDDLLGMVQVRTPSTAADVMLNRWLLYQTLACRLWGRTALYQPGGAYGFRDQLQDVTALLHARPDLARAHILRAAQHQFEEGDVLHWWHPPRGEGVRTRISDDMLWLPYVTAHYVAVTGDTGILDEPAPFLQGEALGRDEADRYRLYSMTALGAPLVDHCERALRRALTYGPHGLPLIGGGDWNDGMNRVGRHGLGESVWLGWFLYATLQAMIPIFRQRGEEQKAQEFEEAAERLRASIEEHAWDGEWYARAFYDDGEPLGSAKAQECKIDSLAQSWAVLSGAGDPERARRAMGSMYERLVNAPDLLALLLAPPFDRTPRDPGYIKAYPPGVRENGGQYNHAAAWAAWAFAELGEADRAMALFHMLVPSVRSRSHERMLQYQVEPYAAAGDICSQPPHKGRGGWTWYTGSAAWTYRVGMEAILGLVRVADTLRFNPCIPGDWSGYSVTYRVGKSRYQIRVWNPHRVRRGVERLVFDGVDMQGDTILLRDDGAAHEVHVVMGGGHGEAGDGVSEGPEEARRAD